MKYVIFHFNTGGFNAHENSIIEVAAIIEDTKNKLNFDSIPKYRVLIYNEIYKGNPLALHLNSNLLKEVAESIKNKSNSIVTLDMLALNLYSWLSKHIDTYIDDHNYMLDFNSFGKSYSNDGVALLNKKNKLLINVGGKNFGVLQHKFLQIIPNINDYLSFNHRFLDPSILFFNKEDESLPNTEECKKRANINSENNISSLHECWDVIEMLRTKLNY